MKRMSYRRIELFFLQMLEHGHSPASLWGKDPTLAQAYWAFLNQTFRGLILTDPAKYQSIRRQQTRLFIRGWEAPRLGDWHFQVGAHPPVLEHITMKIQEPGLNREEWLNKLGQMSAFLTKKTRLHMMGSAACMFANEPERISMDLDVWKPSSTFQEQDLRQACEKAGLVFNPRESHPRQPYLQIVEPGICYLPGTQPPQPHPDLVTAGKLEITTPHPADLIASKLERCEPKDIDDITWLIQTTPTTLQEIQEAVEAMPKRYWRARENQTIARVICQQRDTPGITE